MRKYFQDRENRIVWIIFAITMLIACCPLISKYCINGHDIEYHLLRIESLKEGILIGKPFLKVNTLFFGNAGYASSLFYPDFLLYFPAMLRVCGVGINTSYHLFVACCFCLCYLTAYFCVRQMTHSRYAGMVAAILLTLCQYHIDDVYVRSAAGEYTAFIFLPIVIYGIYNVIYENMSRPWMLGIGFAGVLLCHTSTLIMCLLFGLAAFLIKWKVFAKKPILLGKVILTAVLTAAMTITYWLPVMEQMLTTQFYVSTPWMNPMDETRSFAEIFYPVFPAVGFILILFFLPRILIKKDMENKQILGFADCLMSAGMLFALLATDLVPWNRIGSYLSFIQFPWRFYIMSSALFAVADALVLFCCVQSRPVYDGKKIELEKLVLLIVLAAMSTGALLNLSGNTEGTYDYSDDYYSYLPYTANVIAGEWLPSTVTNQEALIESSTHLVTDTGEELIFNRVKNSVLVEISKEYNYVDVPFIYYKGYHAYLEKETSEKIELKATGEGENGFCRVYLDGQKGTVTVLYDGTFVQGFALGVFLVTVLLLAWLIYRKKRKSSRADDKGALV